MKMDIVSLQAKLVEKRNEEKESCFSHTHTKVGPFVKTHFKMEAVQFNNIEYALVVCVRLQYYLFLNSFIEVGTAKWNLKKVLRENQKWW